MVLEVGTVSGYQAAVLAHRGRVSLSIIRALADGAHRDLNRLGFGNVETRTGDGYYGWPDCGTFDAIVVTAGAAHVPPPLIEQLDMIIPVGHRPDPATIAHRKGRRRRRHHRHVLPVRFVR